MEVAYLTGVMATELGMIRFPAKRAGLFCTTLVNVLTRALKVRTRLLVWI